MHRDIPNDLPAAASASAVESARARAAHGARASLAAVAAAVAVVGMAGVRLELRADLPTGASISVTLSQSDWAGSPETDGVSGRIADQ